MKLKYIIAAFLCSIAVSFAEPFVIHVILKDDKNTFDKTYFGVKVEATDYLDEDKNIGEFELPTLMPPGGLLTGAFQLVKKTDEGTEDVHSYRDYRAVPDFGTGKITYKLKVAGLASNYRILFEGNFPDYITKATAKKVIPGISVEEVDLLKDNLLSVSYNPALLTDIIDIELEYSRKNSVEEGDFAIYPNPTKDYVHIANSEIADVTLATIDGSEYSKKVENGRIYVGDLPSGSYIISGKNANNKRFAKKIVIQ